MQTPKSGDVIKAAIKLAGGRTRVAKDLNLSPATVNSWGTRETIPPQYVRKLSELGGGVISVDALLAAIERTQANKAAP